MEKRIKERFSDRIRAEAGARYGVKDSELESLDGFESFIFRYRRNGSEYILRVSHSIRRSCELIRGEVNWIRHLAGNGVPVADAVPSESGGLVEEISDDHGGSFLATSFRGIQGVTPWEYGWSRELFEQYGELVGKMHRLARSFDPAVRLRPLWSSRELGGDLLKMIPEEQAMVRRQLVRAEESASKLPCGSDCFGLVHFDAHGGNMLIDRNGKINLFDFDDCCWSWFINDLAIVLFYMVTNAPEPEKTAEKFLEPFLSGYSRENSLEGKWLDSIPLFLKIRDIDLYSVLHRRVDVNNLTGWCGTFMDGRRQKVEGGIPYLDMYFSRFGEYLK